MGTVGLLDRRSEYVSRRVDTHWSAVVEFTTGLPDALVPQIELRDGEISES